MRTQNLILGFKGLKASYYLKYFFSLLVFCGDVLNAECGICETWKREDKCKTRSAETLCLATCEHCKQGEFTNYE